MAHVRDEDNYDGHDNDNHDDNEDVQLMNDGDHHNDDADKVQVYCECW